MATRGRGACLHHGRPPPAGLADECPEPVRAKRVAGERCLDGGILPSTEELAEGTCGLGVR